MVCTQKCRCIPTTPRPLHTVISKLIHDTANVIERDESRCKREMKLYIADQTVTHSLQDHARGSYLRGGACVATMGHEFAGKRGTTLQAVVEASRMRALNPCELTRADSRSWARDDRDEGRRSSPGGWPANVSGHSPTLSSPRNLVRIAASFSAERVPPALGAPG